MKIFKATSLVVLSMFAGLICASCDDSQSYADLLKLQDQYVNNFLADQHLILDVPEDSVFITGENAPFYRMNEDATIYMQVLDPGTPGNKVEYDEQIYFRYTRYALISYADGKLPTGSGNTISLGAAWFRYKNYSIASSYNWGTGVQLPLSYLPIDCKVNVIIKAEEGFTSEQAEVQPYLFTLTYSRRAQ